MATLAVLGGAFAHPDAVAVGSSASGRERSSSSVDLAYALAAERDGKLVVVGGSNSGGRHACALARYTVHGRLDRRFGTAGRVLANGLNGPATAVAVQADGKIVVAAGLSVGDRRSLGFGLARYTARGRLDRSFGQDGKVVTHFGSLRRVSGVEALAIQPDGKIVAAGWWSRAAGSSRFALARYTSRGRLDASFGHGGQVLTSFGPREVEPAALLIRRDGKLVVAGDFTSPSGPAAVALARYKRDGTLDRSFGRGGRVVSKLYEYAYEGARAAVLQGNGKVVVNTDDGLDSFLARYTVEGKLDSSFGHGGKAVASHHDRLLPLLALQRGGKLIVAGSVNFRHGGAFALHRYRPDGGVDASFGRGGRVFTDFGAPARAKALAVQANGKIVVAGYRDFIDFAVARYTSSGRLDSSFGRGGKVTTDFGSVWRAPQARGAS